MSAEKQSIYRSNEQPRSAQTTTDAARKGQRSGDTQMAASNQNPQPNRPQITPTDRSVDLRLVDYPVSIDNADLLEQLFVEYDFDYSEIAAFVPETVTDDEIRRRLRFEELLNPWDDAHVLEACYDGYGMSTTEIAETVCDNEITPETVRARLHHFDILGKKSQRVLEEMDPDDLDLSLDVEDEDPMNLGRGSNGGASA